MSRRPAALVLSASTLLAAVLLTGCRVPEPEPSGTTTPSVEPSESASPPASPSPSAQPSSTPVDIACDVLVTREAMYEVNPNFSLLAEWTPDAGTPAAEALAADGVACRWQNDTSGDPVDISVASFDTAALEAKKNATYSASTMVPTYGGDEGYFTVADGVGEAVVFVDSYWLVVRSPVFLEPGDAEPIVSAALSALG
ncbi:MAG: arginyl-tRNA synthetase [Protaetiibacter sp.]